MFSSDPDTPELPPPLEPDSQDTDTPPVYQDINELSCKPDKMVDCKLSLKDDETAKLHQQKVLLVHCMSILNHNMYCSCILLA